MVLTTNSYLKLAVIASSFPRTNSAARAMFLTAYSISFDSVCRPRDILMDSSVAVLSRFMAVNTCEGPIVFDVNALPEDTVCFLH